MAEIIEAAAHASKLERAMTDVEESKARRVLRMAKEAIESDDVEGLRKIVEEDRWILNFWSVAKDPDDNAEKSNWTIFHLAALQDRVLCVKYLAGEGADIHSPWSRSNELPATPLSLAIMCDDDCERESMFASLMDSPRIQNESDFGWQRAMQAAASRGRASIMSAIAQRVGPRGNSLWQGICDPDGERLLHLVARVGSEEALALALSFEGVPAQMSEQSTEGITPMKMAERHGHGEMAEKMRLREEAKREQVELQELIEPEQKKVPRLRI